jgi:D-alanyl-D-alanine carboxypeptidase (penicillin-binding protein 5/6)
LISLDTINTMTRHLLYILTILFINASFVCTIPASFAFQKDTCEEHTKQASIKSVQVGIHKSSGKGLQHLSKNPYSGAVVIDAATGMSLFEDNADTGGYPASLVKLMTLLIILEAVEEEHISLRDKVIVSAEASRMGGSQVYLEEKEVTTVDDLLYALMVQSANDAAVALALHYAGSKADFAAVMNNRAWEIGMTDTVFHSVHGLPPGKGQLPDVSTPRDIARLSLEVLKHPRALHYSSTKRRLFRAESPEPFIMQNHNHLVGTFEGCDGLKTGYFRAAGYSIAATATGKEGRAIAVIMGSVSSRVRDAKARELLSKGLMKIAELSPSPSFTKKVAAVSVYE